VKYVPLGGVPLGGQRDFSRVVDGRLQHRGSHCAPLHEPALPIRPRQGRMAKLNRMEGSTERKQMNPDTSPANSKEESIRHWLELSAYDLDTADAMLRTGRYLYVGFMCQQAVEKAMKACYQQREGQLPPRSHNLLVLAAATGLLDQMAEEQKDLLAELEPLAIEARYPEHKQRMRQLLDEAFSATLLARTREILGWI